MSQLYTIWGSRNFKKYLKYLKKIIYYYNLFVQYL